MRSECRWQRGSEDENSVRQPFGRPDVLARCFLQPSYLDSSLFQFCVMAMAGHQPIPGLESLSGEGITVKAV